MATTNRPAAASADVASAAAETLREAVLVHLVTRATADGLAAAGLLAAACDDRGVPFQVSPVRSAAEIEDRLAGTDAAATPVVVGTDAEDVLALAPGDFVSPLAYEVATQLGTNPDPTVALAGVVGAGAVPSQVTPALVEAASLERGPGVGIPTTDLADGLAHTGLAHAAFSGDPEAAATALADVGLESADVRTLEPTEARRAASLLALAAGGSSDATPRAATAVEQALRPYRTDGPFATLAGYADMLSALAERTPGLAVALIVGGADREAALDTWRAHARAAHAAVRAASTARYDGVLVARTDGPVATVARLLRDFRSPEPVVLAVGEKSAAAASVETSVGDALAAAASATSGSSLASGMTGTATVDPDQPERFIEAFREAL